MIRIEYSPVNQAWLVVWAPSSDVTTHQVLRVFNDKGEAEAYVRETEEAK